MLKKMNIRIQTAIACLIFGGLLQSCNNRAHRLKVMEKQIDCLQNELVSKDSSQIASEFYRQLKDTFEYWIDEKRFETIVSYKNRNYHFSNLLLLSPPGTSGLGFVVEIIELGGGMSSVQIISGERESIEDSWTFRYKGSPVIYFDDPIKSPGKAEKYTEEYLLRGALDLIVAVQYFSGNSCKRNEKFWQDLWTPSDD